MSSPEAYQTSPKTSVDFLNEADFITITPNSPFSEQTYNNSGDFEFIPSHSSTPSADELLYEGKLLPSSQINPTPHWLGKISLNKNNINEKDDQKGRKKTTSFSNIKLEEPRKWFIEEELSPRPPRCTVLWKELLMLRKQRASSSLSPSSLQGGHVAAREEGERIMSAGENNLRRIKKGIERAKSSASVRIRPMVNMTVNCTHGKSKNGRVVDK